MEHIVTAGINLQAVLDKAVPGDTITVEAGATFGQLRLMPKVGSEVITIRSSRVSEIGERRVTPADVGKLAKIVTPSVEPALYVQQNADNYRFVGIEITQGPSVAQHGNYQLVQLGDSSSQTTLDAAPNNIEFDRCWIHTRDDQTGAQRGITMNSALTTVRRCYISGIKALGVETQALGGWNGPGPFLIDDNYLEAAGINILIGGALPGIPNLVPSDIVITNNDLFKPLSWRKADPTFAGLEWVVKNLLELKSARRVRIENNRMENSWNQAQIGWGIIFNTTNDSGAWSVIEDVQFIRNTIKSSTRGINLRGMDTANDTAGRMKQIFIADNLIENLGAYDDGGTKAAFQLLQGTEDVTIDHNTVRGTFTSAVVLDKIEGFTHQRLRITNNLTPYGDYGVFGNGGTMGIDTMNRFASEWALEKNAFIATPDGAKAKLPSNYFPATAAEATTLLGTDGVTVGVRTSTPTPTPAPAPTPSPVPEPTPAPTPPALRKVAWPSGEAKQTAILDAQWKERYRMKRHLSGAYAEFEHVP